MSDVFFQILTPVPLNTQEEARLLFKVWLENAAGFFPDRTGIDEPLRYKISPAMIDEALKNWRFQCQLERIAAPKLN